MIRDYSLSPLSRPPPLLPPALPSIRLSFLFLFTTAPSYPLPLPLPLPRAPVSRPPLQGSGSGSHGGVSEPNFLFLSFSPPSPRMTNAYPPPPTPSLSLLLFVSGEFLGKFPPQPIYLSTYLSSYHFPLPSPLFPSLSSRARGARRHLPSPSAPPLALRPSPRPPPLSSPFLAAPGEERAWPSSARLTEGLDPAGERCLKRLKCAVRR